MPQKEKLGLEQKQKIVIACISGDRSLNEMALKYGVDKVSIKNWCRLYKNRGVEGLIPTLTNKKYPLELKMQAITDYLTGQGSYSEICERYDISDTHIVRDWVKKYTGHEVLKSSIGVNIEMTKGRKTTLEEKIEIVRFCIENGKDYGIAISKHHVSYQQIYNWVRKYEEKGLQGLVDRRGKQKDSFTMTETERLRAENKLLVAKNKRLEIENELLKKLDEIERGRS